MDANQSVSSMHMHMHMGIFLATQLDTREDNESDKRTEDVQTEHMQPHAHQSGEAPHQGPSEVSALALEGDAEMFEFKNIALREFLVMYHEQYVTENSAASHTKVCTLVLPNIRAKFTSQLLTCSRNLFFRIFRRAVSSERRDFLHFHF
jgi:hypothetical protein